MNKSIEQFLWLLSVAMTTNNELKSESEYDWDAVYVIAANHNVIPMIYEAILKLKLENDLPIELMNQWSSITQRINMRQYYNTTQFHLVYQNILRKGITAIVVKGIVLRDLYPNPYYRISGDEDILIKSSDFQVVNEVLELFGFKTDSVRGFSGDLRQEITYQNKMGFRIEIHTYLFDQDTELYGAFNQFFLNVFENHRIQEIDSMTIHTLTHTQHLLFLTLHSVKHFIANGIGIRQLCDFTMYCNKYADEIDWIWIGRIVEDLGYTVYLLNIVDICKKYLGMKSESVQIQYKIDAVHSNALVIDIIESGIFGKSTLEREKSGSITLQAIANNRKQAGFINNKLYILQVVFPNHEYMSMNYSYCKRHLLLLPVAWIHRIGFNILSIKSKRKIIRNTNHSIKVGKERINLFKEYGLIKN